MKRLLKTTALGIGGMLALITLPAYASTVFTMTGFDGSSITGTGSSETVSIDFNNLQVNSTTNYSGTYVETYINTGALTIKEGGSTILSITETPNLAGTFNGSAVSLYGTATALTISSPLLAELGFSSNPPLSDLTAGSFGVTASGSGTNTASSAVSQFTLTTPAVPEPSTFAMFGIGLLSVIGYKVRKRSV